MSIEIGRVVAPWMQGVSLVAASAAMLTTLACGGTAEPTTASTTGTVTATGTGGAGGAGGADGCQGTTAGTGGADGTTCNGPGARYVTQVVSTCFGDQESFGRESFPDIVYGPPDGAGCCGGSLDVVSLGNGGTITVAFGDNAIVDGPGVDFLVFENVFNSGGDPAHPFAELGTVEVSEDGVTFVAFPCTATTYPYGSCAGWHPVYGNLDVDIDPLDPAVAGGDPFDLADLGVKEARFVRITDRADLPGSFDLDAVAIINAACP